jgi:hypothetical protein
VSEAEYPRALVRIIEEVSKTSGWAKAPAQEIMEGVKQTPGHKFIDSRIRWSTYKHATGTLYKSNGNGITRACAGWLARAKMLTLPASTEGLRITRRVQRARKHILAPTARASCRVEFYAI